MTNGIESVYTYNTKGWRDRLTSYNGSPCVYDALGNPTTYKGKQLKWTNLRDLKRYDNVEFEYDAGGIRTKKHGRNIDVEYIRVGNKIIAEKRVNAVCELEVGDYLYKNKDYYVTAVKTDIEYLYGANGLTGFVVAKTGEPTKTYYYRKNIQGDITHI
ncbi:MAG: hypothetical protein LBT20_01070, partial [Clostridiales bacterium]|nr:hypothetical protein [Clostridiales bacterium]